MGLQERVCEMAPECSRQNKWIGSCKWEPRYHVVEPTLALERVLERQWHTTQQDRDQLVRQVTYVGEVCARCGRTNFLVDASERDGEEDGNED